MFAKGTDLDVHIRTQWQRFQNVVKLGRAVDFENADVCPLTGDAPQMQPLALPLQLGLALAACPTCEENALSS